MDSGNFFLRAAEKLDAFPETAGAAACLLTDERRAELYACLLRQACVEEPPAAAGRPEESAKKPGARSEVPDRPAAIPRPAQGSQGRARPGLRLEAIPPTSQPGQKMEPLSGRSRTRKRRPDKLGFKLYIIAPEFRTSQETAAAMGAGLSQEGEV